MWLAIVLSLSRDTIYTLPEEIIDARYYNFKKEFNMNWRIYMRAYDSYPMLFDDVKYVLMSYGGVAPVFDNLSIKGGGPSDNLILVNGIPLITPLYRFFNFLPVDRDAIQVADFYRGDMPAQYDGMLSSVLDVRTSTDRSYVKVGLPSAAVMVKGFLVDYFLPSLISSPKFEWKSHLGLYSNGSVNLLAVDSYRKFGADILRAEDSMGIVTDYLRTFGASIMVGPVQISTSLEDRTIKEWLYGEQSILHSQRNFVGIASFIRKDWGAVAQYHFYSSPNIPDTLYREMGIARDFLSVHAYRKFGPLSLGMAYLSQGKFAPIVMLHYKRFLSDSTALRLFVGTSFQGFISFDYPFFFKFALRDRVSRGYTAIVGYEKVGDSRIVEAEVYARLFYPYFVIYPFSVDEIPPDSSSDERKAVVFGVDFSMEDLITQFRFSITLQRSLMIPGLYPSPGDIRYVFTLQYKYVSAFYVDGPVRSDRVIFPDDPERWRKHPMYVISLHYPFRWKGFDFRIGVYNVFPQPYPDDEFSTMYRGYPIPIISVKREF